MEATSPLIITGWRPKLRTLVLQEKPDWLPEEIYKEACAHKRYYNAGWEEWVFHTADAYNVSQAEAEDACIRGIQKEFYKTRLAYTKAYGEELGNRIGVWFEQFMEMGDIFNKVKHPEYLKELGYKHGTKPIGAENE